MFTDFTATDRWTKKPVHCLYECLIVAIATRHADAVDIKFLVDGRQTATATASHVDQYGSEPANCPSAMQKCGRFLETSLSRVRSGTRNARDDRADAQTS